MTADNLAFSIAVDEAKGAVGRDISVDEMADSTNVCDNRDRASCRNIDADALGFCLRERLNGVSRVCETKPMFRQYQRIELLSSSVLECLLQR